MSRLVVPTNWRTKPQYGFQVNPFFYGLGLNQVLLAMDTPQGFINCGKGSLTGTPISLTTVMTLIGSAKNNNGSGNYMSVGLNNAQVFSRIAVVVADSLASNATISDSNNAMSGGAQWLISTGGEMLLAVANGATVSTTTGAAIGTVAINVLGVTNDAAGNVAFFKNGLNIPASAGSSQTYTTGTGTLFARGDGLQPLTGTIQVHIDFTQALPDNLMRSLTLNPTQVFSKFPSRLLTNLPLVQAQMFSTSMDCVSRVRW